MKQEVNSKLTLIRSIDRLINSEKFDVLFSHANENDIITIENALKDNNREAIIHWIKEKSKTINYNEVNIRDLQLIAKGLGIANYTRLPKALLLYEINHSPNKLLQGK